MNDQTGQPDRSDLPPPGWYQDPHGTTRWWDGVAWGPTAAETQPTAPQQPAVAQQPSAQQPFAQQPVTGQPFAQPYSNPPALDPGAAFSYGWKKFQEYAKEFIVMVIVVALVSLVGVVVAVLALIPAFSGDTTGAIVGWVGYTLAILVATAVSFVVQAGVYRAGLGVTRGVAPSLGMLVDRTNLGTYVGTVLIVALASTVGIFLCILPGLAVLFFAAYAPLIALDTGAGPVESIRRSIDMVRDNIGQVFLLLLLAYAVYYVGSLACYVGLIVSIPVALVMVTYSYRVLNGEPVTP